MEDRTHTSEDGITVWTAEAEMSDGILHRERETRWTDWIKLPFVLSLVSGAGLKYLHVFINFSDFWIYSGEQDDGVCDEDDLS